MKTIKKTIVFFRNLFYICKVMANYNDLKNLLESNVFQNTRGAVTGTVMQSVLMEIVNTVGLNSGFMGILSSQNKPTAVVDGKQFYIGYNAGEDPLNVDLQGVGLSTLTILKNNLYIVHNNGGSWAATDIAQGIATLIATLTNSIDAIDEVTTLLNDERVYIYQSLGVCLIARAQYDDAFPNIAKNGNVLIIGIGGEVKEESIREGQITVNGGDKVWLLPQENASSEDWATIVQMGIFSLFIPSGCPVYNFFANHAGWGYVGAETFGLSDEVRNTYKGSGTEVLSYGNYYSWYSQVDPELTISQYGDREELLANMCNI